MKKFNLSFLAALITNNVVGTAVAMLILNPLTHDMMNGGTSTEPEMEMPSLLAGYFILTLIMVLAYPYFKMDGSWIKRGAIWGLVSGGMAFLSIYLIIAGWSILPTKPMLISGLVDMSSTIATGIVIAYFYRNDQQPHQLH